MPKPPEYFVRLIEDADMPDLLALYHRCEDFLALGPVSVASLEMVQKDRQAAQQAGSEFCGIFSLDGQLCGVLDTLPKGFEGQANTAYIALLMLDPEHRRGGWGRDIFERFESEIKRDPDIQQLMAHVQVNNPGALHFWQQMGFEIAGEAALQPDQTITFPLLKRLVPSSVIEIRPERFSDMDGIWNVEQKAFGRSGEADLVNALRAKGVISLSMVVEQAGELIGHVLFSPVKIRPDEGNIRAVGLGPVAIIPQAQGRGIGAALIRAGLDLCRQAGEQLVVVVGDPRYYSRFGFETSTHFGLTCEYNVPTEVFMAMKLQPDLGEQFHGKVFYDPEFQKV